ncbi:hypothetical protein ETB97_008602 [Aspergillus alliaceus]|uniref:HD domain-containing protein n=1 Tax=Petromyces alliaceus TaxID=209559 RepID=A0A8H5ZXH0_PETAA|nr:hypothetical protein ETB97_008602 [Aspergillus burnettii]
MRQDKVGLNGWTSMPANAGAIFGDRPFIKAPDALSIDNPVVAKTLENTKSVLPTETLNHSMRVYYYGMAITKQQFPKQAATLNCSTWALTCLLHDPGSAKEDLTATRMFNIYGGIKALHILKEFGASSDQAEAASEAIIRHEDNGC